MSKFKIEIRDKTIFVACPAQLDKMNADIFSCESKAWLLQPAENLVIDFSGVTEISNCFYKSVLQLKAALKRDSKCLSSINLSPGLLHQLHDDGVNQAFHPIEKVGNGPCASKHKTPELNVEFLNPFLSAIMKTFEVQCHMPVKVLKPQPKKGPIADIALAGVLSLISNGFSGSIVLSFPKDVFLKIYENMFNEVHAEITHELEDAAAELLNIIYGQAKTDLNQKGYNFQKALPTVLAGEKITVHQSGIKPAVVLPVECAPGIFYVEIEFENII